MGEHFDRLSARKSKELKQYYQGIAKAYGVWFLDAAEVAQPSEADQLHMAADEHIKLASAMASKVETIFDEKE